MHIKHIYCPPLFFPLQRKEEIKKQKLFCIVQEYYFVHDSEEFLNDKVTIQLLNIEYIFITLIRYF